MLRNSTTMIGGIDFLFTNQEYVLPYLICYSAITLNGILGNLLIIVSIVSIKEMRTTANLLILNLAVVDFFICSLVDTFTIASAIIGSSYFDSNFGFCHFIATTCLTLCAASMFNIGLLSVNRYINICHHQMYKKVFTVKKTVFMCLCIWSLALLIDLPNRLGWGNHVYDEKLLVCAWNRLASHSYTIFFSTSSILIPCTCVFLCYMRLFWYVTSSRNKVDSNRTLNTKSKQAERSKSIKLAKSLFSSFIMFVICWLPYAIIVMHDIKDRLPMWAHGFAALLAHANSTFNPYLYAKFNTMFLNAYKTVLNPITFNRLLKPTSKSQPFSRTTKPTTNNSAL